MPAHTIALERGHFQILSYDMYAIGAICYLSVCLFVCRPPLAFWPLTLLSVEQNFLLIIKCLFLTAVPETFE